MQEDVRSLDEAAAVGKVGAMQGATDHDVAILRCIRESFGDVLEVAGFDLKTLEIATNRFGWRVVADQRDLGPCVLATDPYEGLAPPKPEEIRQRFAKELIEIVEISPEKEAKGIPPWQPEEGEWVLMGEDVPEHLRRSFGESLKFALRSMGLKREEVLREEQSAGRIPPRSIFDTLRWGGHFLDAETRPKVVIAPSFEYLGVRRYGQRLADRRGALIHVADVPLPILPYGSIGKREWRNEGLHIRRRVKTMARQHDFVVLWSHPENPWQLVALLWKREKGKSGGQSVEKEAVAEVEGLERILFGDAPVPLRISIIPSCGEFPDGTIEKGAFQVPDEVPCLRSVLQELEDRLPECQIYLMWRETESGEEEVQLAHSLVPAEP